jgi:metallo-beta-lactamase class B
MKRALVAVFLLATLPAVAQNDIAPTKCDSCAAWNAPQKPFRIYGNTYYVGMAGLSAILITSDSGLVLIDGDLAESAPEIAQHIRALGFRPQDIKFILNSHAHYDHAGGLAWLQRASGARVAASAWSARLLRQGNDLPDDPQFGGALYPIAAVPAVDTISDGQTVTVGDLALTAHFTPGHTPGGTSWTWLSCENGRCLHIVYGDSLTTVSADSYRFTDHPEMLAGFEKSFATLAALPCDILLTPHPGISHIFERLKARDGGDPNGFFNPDACRALAASSRADLEKRITQEKTGK